MSELHEALRHWLDSTDPVLRRHAEARLAMLDGTMAPPVPSPVAPLDQSIHAVRLGFRSCLYASHEGCGCSGTHCFRFDRIVELRDCVECIGPSSDKTHGDS